LTESPNPRKPPKEPKERKPPKAKKPQKRKKHRLLHRLRRRPVWLGYWIVQHTLPKGLRGALRRTLFPRRSPQPGVEQARQVEEERERDKV